MDRSDTPTLLLPLLALLAVAFPFAMYRTPAPAGGNNPQASQTTKQEANKEVNEQDRKTLPHTAARLVEEFLQARNYPSNWLDDDPRKEYSLHFMIAIAADPIDSRLPRMFDSSVDSIQRAFEADGYVLDRFDLAWSEPTSTKADTGKSPGTAIKLQEEIPRYRRLPSLLLFRKPSEKKLFLVFLVGETPTSGIHKTAMASALHQLASFYKWDPGHKKLPPGLWNLAKDDPKEPLKIRIMGPSFTGSATSLEFALRDWLAGLPEDVRVRVKLRIVSGSATFINPKKFSSIGAGGPHTFQAVVPPDDKFMPAILSYIRNLGFGHAYRRVAMLTEAGTAYGQKQKQEYVPKKPPTQQQTPQQASPRYLLPEVINLPFPLHISELRKASEKQRQSQQNAAPELNGNYSSSIHLNQGGPSQPKETPPSFSDLGPASSELVLSRLLSTISHEGIHAVGILATDVRDVLFLAREIHQHCPGTLVFTVFSDLLFSHPEVSTSTRGMLVFTPYPLYNLNQVWTPPFLGLGNRIQFRSQDAEGAYNATLALLGRKDLMLDYGQPFPFYPGRTGIGPRLAKPALWVTVVGRNGPLPVGKLRWNDYEEYSIHVKQDFKSQNDKRSGPPTIGEEGIYTAKTALGMALLSALLITLSLLIICRYPFPANVEQEERPSWASRLFGEPVTPEYLRQGRLFLFASLVCVLCADTVLTAVYSVPALVSYFRPENGDWHWLISILQAAGLLLLAVAVVVVLRAYRKAPRNNSFLQLAVERVVFGGCLIVLFLSVRLAIWWLYTAWTNPPEAMFTYVRAFQFFSGLSPLVPLFCVGLAGFLWALCSFRRLRMIDGIRLADDESSGEESLLTLKTDTFKGLKALEGTVRERLEKASAFSTGWYVTLMLMGPLVAIYLFVSPFVPSYEGQGFYFLFGWGFFLVYWALTLEFGRLCVAWAAFRHLLQRLAVHPMQAAYERYHKSFPGLPRIDLAMPVQVFSVLEFSIDQAERLLLMAPSLIPSRDLSGNQRQDLRLWISKAQGLVQDAVDSLAQAFRADAEGKWRRAVMGRSQSQQALGKLAQLTAELLEPSWRPTKNTPPFPGGKQFKDFRELGEEFLAGRVVLFISYVLPTLRKLGTFILIGLLLMFASVMFYPFVQKNHFLAFNWIVILGFVALVLLVTLQMERDVVLSALNGTTPGQVKITRQFTFRILTYVMIPILLLLGAQFPDTFGWVISLFTRFQGH